MAKETKKPIVKNIIIFVIAIVVLAAIFSYIEIGKEQPEEIGIGTFVELVQNEEIERIKVKGEDITITKTDGSEVMTRKESTESFSELISNYNIDPVLLDGVAVDIISTSGSVWFSILIPTLIPVIVIVAVLWFILRQAQGQNVKAMSFGQSGVKTFDKKKHSITFKDVAGVKEAKEELAEVVDFLKNPKKFTDVGAQIPKGALLMGAPGTGKTLLAKAVAGEAKVPFFHISGSEFVEMFVGVGASRVRDLFETAKKSAPCIIFIDEIDAVGRQRGAGVGGSHDEREQTLNQILVEMDGFEPNQGVIVLAATNRPDILDPALLRPGRFDRRIILDMPDIKARQAILEIHAKGKPLAKEVDLKEAAERTPGFSGADLRNLLNEAAIATARQDKKTISKKNVLDSVEKVLLGPERKSNVLSKKEKKITAYHEAGHALVAHYLPKADPVHKISIISRGPAAGYTLKLPTEDRKLHSRDEFLEEIAVMLGGHVVERITFNDITTGASDDLRKATQLARDLITRYGMSEKLGARTYGKTEEMIFLGKEIHEQRDYSEKVAEQIDGEISRIIREATETAEKILKDHNDDLETVVEKLLKNETIERLEFESIFKEKKS